MNIIKEYIDSLILLYMHYYYYYYYILILLKNIFFNNVNLNRVNRFVFALLNINILHMIQNHFIKIKSIRIYILYSIL